MSGSISITPQKSPTITITPQKGYSGGNITGFATGGAPGNITVPGPRPTATPQQAQPAQTQIYQAAPAAPAPVYAPALDTGAIYNRASAAAASNVNPYYTKLLNDFITNQATAKQQQQQQTDFNIQSLKDQLAQVQKANTVTGTRATEDAATTEAQAAEAANNRQIDQGTVFNDTRNAEAIKLAESGLTGSGIATGQQIKTQQTQDVTEQRQAQADQEAKNATELTKARTFEDLTTSNTNATTAEGKGETQAHFDLNKFIVGQTSDLQQYQGQTEIARQNAINAETAKQTHLLVQQFINSIANPAQRQAAISAYGNL